MKKQALENVYLRSEIDDIMSKKNKENEIRMIISFNNLELFNEVNQSVREIKHHLLSFLQNKLGEFENVVFTNKIKHLNEFSAVSLNRNSMTDFTQRFESENSFKCLTL